MKKFQCSECTAEATKYVTYKGFYSGEIYYAGFCSAHYYRTAGDNLRDITYEDIIAAMAMKAL